MKLYLIWLKKDDYIYEDPNFAKQVVSSSNNCEIKHTYEGCFKDSNNLKDIYLQKKMSKDLPFHYITGSYSFSFFSMKFVQALGYDFILDRFFTGDIFYGSNKLDKYITVFPKEKSKIILRGSNKSTLNICPKCGKTLYYAWADHLEYYVIANTFNATSSLYMTSYSSIVVDETILSKIYNLVEDKYYVVELPVLLEPLDGYEKELLNVW